MSGLAALVPLLTADNCAQLLERATHRTKRQIEELVAELATRRDVAEAIRRLPEARELSSVEQMAPIELVPGRVPDAVGIEVVSVSNNAVPAVNDAGQQPASSSFPVVESLSAAVKALSPGRYKVQFTASATLGEALMDVRRGSMDVWRGPMDQQEHA